MAVGEYDHVRDFAQGLVRAEGIDIDWLDLPIEEIFYRFLKYREWDISELSFAKYVALTAQGGAGIGAIPVFVSRVFRHSSFYVRSGGPVKQPRDLKGKRIGIPEWAQTAAVYTRGYLVHEIGIRLQDIEWIQAGVNQPGRVEKIDLKLPRGVRYRRVVDKSLSEMLLSGEIDCMLSARAPQPFLDGDRRIRRLMPEYRNAELDYFRRTGIFPIMHVIALRAEVLRQHPWAAMNLLKAFEESKRRSLARIADITASYYPLAWLQDIGAEARKVFGDDPWPYGIDANRATLDAFLRYAHEQGVASRKLKPEDLFPASVQSRHRV